MRDLTYQEVEATLAICAEDPERVIEQLQQLSSIGSYGLRPIPPLAIVDVYLDLARSELGKLGLGLRLRTVGQQTLITLKGPKDFVVGGGASREEFERPWSCENLSLVLGRLENEGLEVRRPGVELAGKDPLEVMAGLGFAPTQVRHTKRRPRDVVHGGEPSTSLAELVIDSVAYEIGGRTILHHEIEIEVKAGGDIAVMQNVADELLASEPHLRRWDHGKRATGRAIEELLDRGHLEELIRDDGSLKSPAYDVIEQWICGLREDRA